MLRSIAGFTLLSFTLTTLPIGVVWAAPAPSREAVVYSTSPQGPWTSEKSPAATWVRSTGKTDALVRLDKGVTARLAPGAQLQVTSEAGKCQLNGLKGRVYVRVASAPIALDAGHYEVQATQSEFLVETGREGLTDLKVISGDAAVVPTELPEPKLIAGSDRRARGVRRDRVTNRKDNTKGIGRIKKPPTPPAAVEPVPPPPVGFVGPEAPVGLAPTAEFLPIVAAGAGLLGPLLGLVGVGGITGIVVGTSGPTDNPPIVFPASP